VRNVREARTAVARAINAQQRSQKPTFPTGSVAAPVPSPSLPPFRISSPVRYVLDDDDIESPLEDSTGSDIDRGIAPLVELQMTNLNSVVTPASTDQLSVGTEIPTPIPPPSHDNEDAERKEHLADKLVPLPNLVQLSLVTDGLGDEGSAAPISPPKPIVLVAPTVGPVDKSYSELLPSVLRFVQKYCVDEVEPGFDCEDKERKLDARLEILENKEREQNAAVSAAAALTSTEGGQFDTFPSTPTRPVSHDNSPNRKQAKTDANSRPTTPSKVPDSTEIEKANVTSTCIAPPDMRQDNDGKKIEEETTRLIPADLYDWIMTSPEQLARWGYRPKYPLDYSDLSPDNMEILGFGLPFPQGWVCIKCTRSPFLNLADVEDYGAALPEDRVVEKKWNPNDISDPNYVENTNRAGTGLPPVDYWNVGWRYI
jgi:hypothetical protein